MPSPELIGLPDGVIARTGSANKGGLGFLDLPNEKYQALINKYLSPSCDEKCAKALGDEEFWKRYNKPFLEKAFKRGDDIRLVSDPDRDGGALTGFYKREIEEIEGGLASRYGYIYDASTSTYKKQ